MIIVRKGGGIEFQGGEFGELPRSRAAKHELTTIGSPQLNGVGLIETHCNSGLCTFWQYVFAGNYSFVG